MKKVMMVVVAFLSFCIFLPGVDAKEADGTIPFELQGKALEEIQSRAEYLNVASSNIELRYVRELYHTDDTVIGYYVHIYEGDKIVGYALISAKESLGTLLEWGAVDNGVDTHYGEILAGNPQQKAYYLTFNDIVFADNLNDLNKILEEAKQKYIEHAKEYDPSNIKFYEEMNFGIDLREASIEQNSIEEQIKSETLMTQEISDFSISERDSETLTNDIVSPLATLPDTLSVSRIWQRQSGVANPNSSCGPTVGVMIANYYRNVRGITEVRNSGYYGNDAKHINQMYYMMNSYFWGTNQYSFHNGLETQLNLNKNQFTAKSRAYNQSGVEEPTFANVQNAINKKYPLGVIEFLNASSGELRYHWTVIAAYNSKGEVGYYDSDGGQYNTGLKFVSWSSLNGKIGYTYLALN
ncbi:hypothetical protein ACOMCU_02060 [Lysinibacillus sp. UGB7]|uniref:hypothetical protein n=1 Tax=Lysinibacillus sp. UGB7 TaxID=3411039 RepID=UPI003B7B2BD0